MIASDDVEVMNVEHEEVIAARPQQKDLLSGSEVAELDRLRE